MKRKLGVCYYPEQWPEANWAADARNMASLGLKRVRIGEFAWSLIEPDPGRFDWGWLDRAVDALAASELEIMLGTPTATPPKWLVDRHPDILAQDKDGRPRRFGSRRHYCFSSARYREEAARIIEAIASRYGRHEAVTAWQTDNEYGCHDTVRSYSPAAAVAFREWLRARYGDVGALNAAWGTSFWSQTYRNFEEVDLPFQTTTEPNPSHALDFRRFSSDQVAAFNRLQTEIIRPLSPGRAILHNYMGLFFDFDHFALGADLDVAGWDSYPLGSLDVGPFGSADKARYLRQGHPDFAAFHHDLYRGVGRGRFEVVEQQPGPVNWARHNPAPLPGMARLWALESFAHGAESVSYFRWRQAPFAQEQMHSGLERPDGAPAPAFEEARSAAREAALFDGLEPAAAEVAIIFSYEACWIFDIQPQGAAWSYPEIVFEWYSALRRLGVDVDIVGVGSDLTRYRLVLAPSLPILTEKFIDSCAETGALLLFGPRTGSKTEHFQTPPSLPPGLLQRLIPLKVAYSESFPAGHREPGRMGEIGGRVWLDVVETDLKPLAEGTDGKGFLFRKDRTLYLATIPDDAFLNALVFRLLQEAGVAMNAPPDGARIRRIGDLTCAFNYAPEFVEIDESIAPAGARFLLGGRRLPPAGVAVWRAR